jgi:hypothetical protein
MTNRKAFMGNATGEVIDVPQPEILVDPNWSYGRRT